MKSLLFIFFLFTTTRTIFADFEDNFNVDAESKAHIKKIEADCISKHNVDPKKVKEYDEGKFTDDLKCFHKCVFVALDLMDENGVFKTDNLHTIVKEKDWAAADGCVALRGREPCDNAHVSYKCYVEYILKHKN